jgi:hypothetical protein
MFEDITGMSREEILDRIKDNGFFISNIKDPDEEMQLTAIEENFFSIRCIQNPTEATQVEAVNHHRYVIKYIKHPCKKALEVAKDLTICEDLTPNGPYHFYEPVYTTMDQIMEQLECYINPKVKFFKYKKLETAMNYLFKQDEWCFENGSRACKIDIRKIDFDKLNNIDKWYVDFFNHVERTEFGHGEEIDFSYFILPCLQEADYCPDGMADYLVFKYEGVLYLITILCFE